MSSNFRKPPTKMNHRGGMDGFVNSGRAVPRNGSIGNFSRMAAARPAQPAASRVGTMGDFRRANGFHPTEQPVVAQPGRPSQSVIGFEPDRLSSDDSAIKAPKAKKRRLSRLGGGHKSKKHFGWKKLTLRASIAVVLIVIITGGFLFGKGYLKARQIFKGGGRAAALEENIDPTKLNGEGDGRINILLLGKGGLGHEAPDLTDTIIVASIDPVAKEAALLSIPRDLYVSVPQYGSMKINAAYATGKNSVLNGRRIADQANVAEQKGLETIEKTITATLGIPVHYHVMIDFTAFKQAIDTVGGVTVTVDDQLYDPTVAWENHNNPVLARAGLNTFNGSQALLFARSRHGSSRGDFDRAERQRLIILALKEKVLSAGTYSNPVKISQLMSAFGDHVRTNLSIGEVKRLYDIGKDITGNKVSSLGLADPPNNYVTTSTINGQSVVVPRTGVGNFAEIQAYVRNALRDSFLKSENASIIILNGTTRAGLATTKANELKSYGYNVTKVDDAPTKNYEDTILVDLRNSAKKYTRNYLEKRLGVAATTSLPDSTIEPGTADFVIILGQSEQAN